MACTGCQRRREWIAKWVAIAKERARAIVSTEPKKDAEKVK
ncbi:TPA: DUF1289 domain-containing protein [Pseudomonas aeruginosa]|nr:DUF1289 domain-containing protein [Pseudomonas aeruginosa]